VISQFPVQLRIVETLNNEIMSPVLSWLLVSKHDAGTAISIVRHFL
jgi:hypothetical protein